MSYGQWHFHVIGGVRPNTALVVSGPEGAGKTLLVQAICERIHAAGIVRSSTGTGVTSPTVRTVTSEGQILRGAWGPCDVLVIQETVSRGVVVDLVTNTEWRRDAKNEAPYSMSTPLAVIVETTQPEQYQGRRFVHINLGE